MKPKDLIHEAMSTLVKRGVERDVRGTESVQAHAVRIFNALKGTNLTEDDAFAFLQCLKLARNERGQFNTDHYVDLIGYTALRGALRSGAPVSVDLGDESTPTTENEP